MISACRCGHARDLHQHYRPGTDCAAIIACTGDQCPCPRYRRPRLLDRAGWSIRFLASLAADIGRAPRSS